MTGSVDIELAAALLTNAVIVAAAFATLRQTVRGLTEAIQKLDGRMAAFDAFCDQSSNDRTRINVRLEQLERGQGDARELRDELMRLSARVEVQHRGLDDSLARLRRTTTQLQRQVASLATGRAGVAFTTEPFGPGDRT